MDQTVVEDQDGALQAIADAFPGHDEFVVVPKSQFDSIVDVVKAGDMADALDAVSVMPVTLVRPDADGWRD